MLKVPEYIAGASWVKSNRKGVVFSELGENVANLLGIFHRGIYHAEKDIQNVEWSSKYCIEVPYYHSLASFDFNQFTRLMLLAHQFSIRVEIRPHTFHLLKLQFHQRKPKEEGDLIYDYHPTIEQAIEAFSKEPWQIKAELPSREVILS